MRCPTPCEDCGAVVELSEMRKLRGGLGAFVCVECWEKMQEDGSFGSCERCGCDLHEPSPEELCDQCLWWVEQYEAVEQ